MYHHIRRAFENPIAAKWLWAMGIGAGVVAITATSYAATHGTLVGPGNGTATPGQPLTDGATMAAVQTIILGFENGTGTPIDLCAGGSAAVTAFQTAWNAAIQGNSNYTALPTTGKYDAATAAAAQQVNGSAPTSSC